MSDDNNYTSFLSEKEGRVYESRIQDAPVEAPEDDVSWEDLPREEDVERETQMLLQEQRIRENEARLKLQEERIAEQERRIAEAERRLKPASQHRSTGNQPERSRQRSRTGSVQKERAAREERVRRERRRRESEEADRAVKRRVRKGKAKRAILLVLVLILILGGLYLYRTLSRLQAGVPIDAKVNDEVSSDVYMMGYTNIALFGVDSTEGALLSGNNRSDMIMVASINDLTGEVKLVSVYRDTMLRISDDIITKCNAAYAYGGPEQAVNMLNRNLDLNITDYATVGFGGLADVIDLLGGIELEITEDEIHYLNDYQSTMAEPLGKAYIPIEAAGVQTVNGLQATAYCRIRYTAGDDFRRTERQRTVLMQTLAKAKSSSPKQIAQITELMSDEVSTSLSKAKMLELMAQMIRMDVTDTVGFPASDKITTAMIEGQSFVVPVDLKANVIWLHGLLFEDSNYQVSDEVAEISQKITAITGY